MTALRAQIEDAVVTLLAPLKKPLLGGATGGYLEAVRPYNGEFDRKFESADEVRQAVNGRWPCVLVGSSEKRFRGAEIRRRRHVETLNVDLWTCSACFRSPEARSRGDGQPAGADPGVFQIMEDVHKKLQGQTVAVAGVGKLEPELEERWASGPPWTVWRMTYSCQADLKAPAPAGTDLTEILGKYQLEAARWYLAQGQGDSFARSGSTMTLTDAAGLFLAAHVGQILVVTGALSAGNNSPKTAPFVITAVLSATQIQYTNANGVDESYTGSWEIRPAPAAQTLATQ